MFPFIDFTFTAQLQLKDQELKIAIKKDGNSFFEKKLQIPSLTNK